MDISFFLMDDEIADTILFIPERYHGCGLVNRNDTRKLIDYKRGGKCLLPTNSRGWRKTKRKHLVDRPYLTHRRVRILKLLKQKVHFVTGFN